MDSDDAVRALGQAVHYDISRISRVERGERDHMLPLAKAIAA